MNRSTQVVIAAFMAVAMLALLVSPAMAAKPTTRTLNGYLVILGVGSGTEFPAGKSDVYQIKFRDVPFLLEGDIATPGGFYHGNMMVKLSGESTWIGTWTMETATVAGIGSGSLKIGSSWDEDEPEATWWITGATGDVNGLKGRGVCYPITEPFLYGYSFEVQIP